MGEQTGSRGAREREIRHSLYPGNLAFGIQGAGRLQILLTVSQALGAGVTGGLP